MSAAEFRLLSLIVLGCFTAMSADGFMRWLGALSYRWWRTRMALRSFEKQQRQWLRDWKKSDPKGAPRR